MSEEQKTKMRQEKALTERWLANAVKATEGQIHGNYSMKKTKGSVVKCEVRLLDG